MAYAIAKRQAPASPSPTNNAFSPPSGFSIYVTPESVSSAFVPESTPDAASLTFAPEPTPDVASISSIFDPFGQSQSISESWVETVILIAPSGTVGGSIIITSVLEPQTIAPSFSTLSPESSIPFFTDTFQSLPTIIEPSHRTHHFSFTRSASISSSDPLSITTTDPPSTFSTGPPTSLSMTTISTISASPSTTSLASTSKSISSSVTTSSSSSSQQSGTALAIAQKAKAGGIGPGGFAAIGVGLGGFLLLLCLGLVFFCHRRSLRRPRSPQVYPEEAFLYDPPIVPADVRGPIETTEYRRAGETGSVYGMQGEDLVTAGLVRPPTPDAFGAGGRNSSGSSPEREGLLGRMRRSSRPRTASSSLMNTMAVSDVGREREGGMGGGGGRGPAPTLPSMRGILSPISPPGYAPAPTEEIEADVADQDMWRTDNPFRDPPDTSYNGGTLVVQNPDEIQPSSEDKF